MPGHVLAGINLLDTATHTWDLATAGAVGCEMADDRGVTDELPLHSPLAYAAGFPHERFARLREEDPVSYHEHPVWERGYWVVSRHEDVQRVSRDSAAFKNSPHPFVEEAASGDSSGMSELLISFDPPEHSKLRRLISSGFTPRRVNDLAVKIRDRVDAIIDSLAEQGSCDLVTDLAVWLPLHVIADLVGVPEEDRAQVFEWTEITFGFDPEVPQEARGEAAMAMYAYADAICQERQDDPRDDLMSVLLHAEIDGEQLTQLQVDLFFLLLQNAGSETTRNLITTGTMALIQNPDQLALVQSDLSVLPTAIEEMLRFASPVIQFVRRAEEDTEVAGQAIAKDDRLAIFYPSANRDHRVFDEPDRLDVTRDPNDHVAFGAGGPHHCLGANLARLEGRVMFESILGRFEGLELAADPADLTRVHSNLIDGFTEVPITWQRVKERVGA